MTNLQQPSVHRTEKECCIYIYKTAHRRPTANEKSNPLTKVEGRNKRNTLQDRIVVAANHQNPRRSSSSVRRSARRTRRAWMSTRCFFSPWPPSGCEARDGRQDLGDRRAGRRDRAVAEGVSTKLARLLGLEALVLDDLVELLGLRLAATNARHSSSISPVAETESTKSSMRSFLLRRRRAGVDGAADRRRGSPCRRRRRAPRGTSATSIRM